MALSAVASQAGIDREFLVELLKLKTPTPDIAANNAAVAMVKDYLERRGVTCTVLTTPKGRQSLYASCVPGKEHDYLFVSHLDVVPAMHPDQFVPRQDGDWLIARGACDTKGNVAVMCQVLVELVGKVSLGMFLATDEEGGPPEGGEATPALSIEAGFRPRKFIIVGDSAGEEEDQLFYAQKGHAKFDVIAHGRGGHSSRPWALDNPVPKLVAGWSKVLAAMPPMPTAEEKWRDCLSPTMMKAGAASNQIGDTAEVLCSLRFTEPGGHEKWRKFLVEQTGLEVRLRPKYREPVVTDPNDPNVQAVFKSLRKRMPSIRLGRMSAATDASYYAPLRIPTVIFAANGRDSHGADERISLKSLDAYADAFVEFFQKAPSAGVVRDSLADGFRAPPAEARPHTWWHWMNGNVSRSGITADLEAMARVGIGGVQMFDAGLLVPRGSLAFDTPEWYDTIGFAIREAERLGLSFGLSNCSGWASTGGPWVPPEYGMKFVTNVELRVTGPKRLEAILPQPKNKLGFYRDIAVVAFPTPKVKAPIPDFDRRIFRRRGSEDGPIVMEPMLPYEFGPESCVRLGDIRVITSAMDASGRIVLDVPSGDWTIVRFGYVCNGMTNHPGSQGGVGLEVDKLDSRALDLHFDRYVMKILAAAKGSKAFDNVLIDSYEVNAQNWTHGFEKAFRSRKGYDILPYLPILAGYPIDSPAKTDAFLVDFRRVIADLFAENYAGRMAERCREIGVKFACEPYGTSPSDDLQYGSKCDIPMCEFWVRRGDGIQMRTRWGHRWRGNARTVASSAHVWGKPIIGAEAFTAYPTPTTGRYLDLPSTLKAHGDMILADGVNRMYFHRFVHQPQPVSVPGPGFSLGFYGSHLERTATWWENGMKAYVAYLTRAQYLLQQGVFVADVLMDTGDASPSFGTAGEIPEGWRGDHISQAARERLKFVEDGVIAPSGLKYRILAHPGDDVAARLQAVGCERDFICSDSRVNWIHRRAGGDEIYFVASPTDENVSIVCSFRDGAGEPELWNPETGEIFAADCRRAKGRAEVKLDLEPSGSIFVVFRSRPTAAVRPRPALAEKRRSSIEGPWQVSFRAPNAADDALKTTFPKLVDWTARPEEAIRYFSGTATYAKRLSLMRRPDERVILDLGKVCDIAEVRVNGRGVRCLWKKPFRVDITDSLSVGLNSIDLEIRVTNRWANRLIGDERLCKEDAEWQTDRHWKMDLLKAVPDWVKRGEKSPTGRQAFSMCKFYKATDELLPSGLLGPVSLSFK